MKERFRDKCQPVWTMFDLVCQHQWERYYLLVENQQVHTNLYIRDHSMESFLQHAYAPFEMRMQGGRLSVESSSIPLMISFNVSHPVPTIGITDIINSTCGPVRQPRQPLHRSCKLKTIHTSSWMP